VIQPNSRGTRLYQNAEVDDRRVLKVAKTLKLGRRVEYRDGAGFRKLGIVTGTAETVTKGTGVTVPGQGNAHILVISPTGKQYHREDVPAGAGPRTYTLL
jgi:hypothetical protein